MSVCPECGETVSVGAWPWCPHKVGSRYQPFKEYFDIGLGTVVTSDSQRTRHMRRHNLEARNDVPNGEMSARKDRRHEIQKSRSS